MSPEARTLRAALQPVGSTIARRGKKSRAVIPPAAGECAETAAAIHDETQAGTMIYMCASSSVRRKVLEAPPAPGPATADDGHDCVYAANSGPENSAVTNAAHQPEKRFQARTCRHVPARCSLKIGRGKRHLRGRLLILNTHLLHHERT